MRKKEPPSPIMAAAGLNAQQTHAVTKALQWKRKSIDQEIEEFRARKELEFKNFEEKLSKGATVPDQVELLDRDGKPQPDLQPRQDGGGSSPEPHASADPAAGVSVASTNDDKPTSAQPSSPMTPLHDKERELHGLFLPYFIPLLDSASIRRSDASPSTASAAATTTTTTSTAATTAVTTTTTTLIPTAPGVQGAELPAQPEGFNSSDPSTLSPRTSPSPSLMPLDFPFPATQTVTTPITNLTDLTDLTSTLKTKSSTPEQQRSPSPLEDLTADLPPLTRTLSRTASAREPSPELVSPQPVRPSIGTRSSSTQSEASTRSLRSSLRKSHSDGPSHGRKKSVRISINDIVLEPGGESPVQTRNAWKIPERKNDSSGGDGPLSRVLPETEGATGIPANHVENIASLASVRSQSSTPKKIKSTKGGKAGQKSKRPPPLDQPLKRSSSDPGYESTFIPSFYPPQQLKSPSKQDVPRPNGRELIEPTVTPPVTALDFDQDDVFGSDPMFPDSSSGEGPGWTNQDSTRRYGSNDRKARTRGGVDGNFTNGDEDLDQEDMFQDYEDGREEMDVVNGHDLLDWEQEQERKSARKQGRAGHDMGEEWFNIGSGPHRRSFRRDEDSGGGSSVGNTWASEVSTSPHAGSLPIEIRGPPGWVSSGWR